MALKLLNPGTRPLGQFDLADADQGKLVGGEYVELVASGPNEKKASDASQYTGGVMFQRSSRTLPRLGGLADDGVDEYGTLVGSLIGQTAGRATRVNGSVIVGPNTSSGSGKVTVWAQAGLYGVSGAAAVNLSGLAVNTELYAHNTTGLLDDVADGSMVATIVGPVSDSSLVSTTAFAAGEASSVEYYAVFYTGPGGYDF